MANYSTAEFKKGLRILLDGEPYAIVEAEHYKPGKGHAYMRTKIRNLKNGKILDKTFLSGENVEAADSSDRTAQYLYASGDSYHFMYDDGSFEQQEVSAQVLGETKNWLKEEWTYILTVFNGQVLNVVPPPSVELEVVETDPGVRGDTVSGGTKPAKLETGAVVKVPLFVKIGDRIKVNTESGEYTGRANSGF